MADSPASISGCYKWLTGSYNTGYGPIDTSNKSEENQPAAPDKPAQKDPKRPTLDDFFPKR